jgi:hypothetical protein
MGGFMLFPLRIFGYAREGVFNAKNAKKAQRTQREGLKGAGVAIHS